MFLAGYASYRVNTLEVGEDLKRHMNESKGKAAKFVGRDNYEKLRWKVMPKHRVQKISSIWKYCTFLVAMRKIGEILVSTKEGIQRVRSVRRIL